MEQNQSLLNSQCLFRVPLHRSHQAQIEPDMLQVRHELQTSRAIYHS